MVTSSEDKVMEPEHGTTLINGNLKTNPSPLVEEVDVHTSTKRTPSSSVSSSPASPLDNSFRDVDYEPDKSIPSTASSPGNDHRVIQLDSVNEKKPGSVSCVSKNELSDTDSPLPVSAPAVTGDNSDSSPDNMLATKSPPTQVMERSTDEPYRIPSSVFARNNSTSPMEWSVASNESLFSIHMGNMSFTKDHLLWPSGELGTPREASVSGQMCNFSVHNSPACKSAESRSGELRTEAEANITKEEKRESEEDQDNEKSIAEGHISRVSEESSHSTKSFAFPVLAGDVDHGSVRMADSARVSPDTQQPKSQPQPQPTPNPLAQPEPKAAEATQQASSTKWFPCFTCCSFCS